MGVVMSVKDPNYTPLPFPPGEQGGGDPAGGAMQASVNVKSLYKLVRYNSNGKCDWDMSL